MRTRYILAGLTSLQVPRCGADCDPQHGYCVKPGECECNLGWAGPACRDCVTLPGCTHGYCKKSFECRCEEGWEGMFCTDPVCTPECRANNGECSAPGECRCRPGTTGPQCQQCQV